MPLIAIAYVRMSFTIPRIAGLNERKFQKKHSKCVKFQTFLYIVAFTIKLFGKIAAQNCFCILFKD